MWYCSSKWMNIRRMMNYLRWQTNRKYHSNKCWTEPIYPTLRWAVVNVISMFIACYWPHVVRIFVVYSESGQPSNWISFSKMWPSMIWSECYITCTTVRLCLLISTFKGFANCWKCSWWHCRTTYWFHLLKVNRSRNQTMLVILNTRSTLNRK